MCELCIIINGVPTTADEGRQYKTSAASYISGAVLNVSGGR